jgi:hypothetical protein
MMIGTWEQICGCFLLHIPTITSASQVENIRMKFSLFSLDNISENQAFPEFGRTE